MEVEAASAIAQCVPALNGWTALVSISGIGAAAYLIGKWIDIFKD